MRKLTIYLLIHCSAILLAQNQNNNWFFGSHAGLSFNTSPPMVVSGNMFALEGSSAISNSNGNLLFYTNGTEVWDRNHNVMPNGSGLIGGASSTQAALIIPLPNSNSIFYLFTTESEFSNGVFAYSIIDMSLNNGNGDIIDASKNIFIADNIGEKVTAILHSNHEYIWVITHKLNSSEFLAYLLTDSGLITDPIISDIGTYHPQFKGPQGPIISSHDGKQIISSCPLINCLDMFDFNSSTGELTNFFDLSTIFNNHSNFYGAVFSLNNRFVYLSSDVDNLIYQINLQDMSYTLIESGKDFSVAGLQIGPNGKIYVAKYGSQFLDIINHPNNQGITCDYIRDGTKLFDSTFCTFGMPNLPPFSLFPDTVSEASLGTNMFLCYGDSTNLQMVLPLNCFPIDYLWNTGSTEPDLWVTEPGTYWVIENTTCGKYIDTILISSGNCKQIIEYDLDSCVSRMNDGTNMDYSEFIPEIVHSSICASIFATNLFRVSDPENKHSCTIGIDSSIAMCISSSLSCEYDVNDKKSLLFQFDIDPNLDSSIWVTSLSFFQKAPKEYSWVNGPSGPNNYPKLFGIRILKNNKEIFLKTNIQTSNQWEAYSISFLNDSLFFVDSFAVFQIELLPYCPVNNSSIVSAWDVDNITISGLCVPRSESVITGNVYTKDKYPISDVLISLSSDSSFTSNLTTKTNNKGFFNFKNINSQKSYYIKCNKNDDILTGVNTLDLIQIKKHLLGVQPFTTLFQFIAADIDNSGDITVKDLIELKKVILGINTNFPNNTSWRFGVATIDTISNVLTDFKEINLINYNDNLFNSTNFIGVKTGDPSGNAISGKSDIALGKRSTIEIDVLVENSSKENVQISKLHFRSKDLLKIDGLQFGLLIDDFHLTGIENGIIAFTTDDYYYNNGLFQLSWQSDTSFIIYPNQDMFCLTFESKIDSEPLTKFTNHLTLAEVYNDDQSINEISFLIRNNQENEYSKYKANLEFQQSNSTIEITFNLTKTNNINFELYDLTGKMVSAQKGVFQTGQGTLSLDISHLPKNLYICHIQSEELNRSILFFK